MTFLLDKRILRFFNPTIKFLNNCSSIEIIQVIFIKVNINNDITKERKKDVINKKHFVKKKNISSLKYVPYVKTILRIQGKTISRCILGHKVHEICYKCPQFFPFRI